MRFFKLIFIAFIFLAGVTTIILGSLYFYRNTEKKTLTAAERKQQPGSYIKLSQGVTHYQLGGPDTGQVVVLVHGFSVPYYIWDGTFDTLAAHGYRVLRYDQYGRGFSDRPEVTYNHELYFNQLKELLAALRLKTPIDLMGVSFGGRMATDFTVQYPNLVNRLVLIDPGYQDMQPDKPEIITRYYECIHPRERALSQLADFKYPNLHKDWVKKYQVQMQYHGFVNALVSTMYNYDCDGPKENTLLNAKNKRILLIWGRDDKTDPFNYSDSVRSVLKTEFFPVDDSGHLPHIEQADTVQTRILHFLKKQ